MLVDANPSRRRVADARQWLVLAVGGGPAGSSPWCCPTALAIGIVASSGSDLVLLDATGTPEPSCGRPAKGWRRGRRGPRSRHAHSG